MIRQERHGRISNEGHELREHGTVLFPAALYDCEWSWETPSEWHWHDELEAVLVVEGDALAASGGSRERLRPGDGFFINSGGLHNIWLASEEQPLLRTHTIVFHPRLVGGSPDSVFWNTYVSPFIANQTAAMIPLHREDTWCADALACLENVWDAGIEEAYGYEFEIRAQLSNFLLQLSRRFPSDSSGPSKKELRNNDRIKRMLQYVRAHYAEDMTISQIAAAASVSDRECLRCFRETIGVTPTRYVKEYRIQTAAQLLSSSDRSVSDVASACGFQDMSYFAKTFREIRGCAPSEYKKMTDRSSEISSSVPSSQ